MNASELRYGRIRLLDVPHAKVVADEIFDQDCYYLDTFPERALVIDVGAFYGEFALRSAVEKRSRVFAYEPSPENRRVLEENCRANLELLRQEGTPEITILPVALGRSGRRGFMTRPEHPAGSMFADAAVGYGLIGSVSEVDCVNLADEVERLHAEFPGEPICLKLDCEGAEVEIFEGSLSWLRLVSLVTMEWHNQNGRHFRDLFEREGFSTKLEGGGPKPRPTETDGYHGGLVHARRLSL